MQRGGQLFRERGTIIQRGGQLFGDKGTQRMTFSKNNHFEFFYFFLFLL